MTWTDPEPEHPFAKLFAPPSPEQLAEARTQRDHWAAIGETMRPFLPGYSGPQAVCRKCGATGAATIHHQCEVHEPCLKAFGRHEGLWRRCTTCGFTWPERCLDDDGRPDDAGPLG